MTTLWLDLETFSTVPITHGTHRYAEEAEVLLVALAIDDDPVQVWDTSDPEPRKSQLSSLQNIIDAVDEIVIHKSDFDRTVLRHCGVHIPVEKIVDTMVLALQHSLPGSLDALCDVLHVPVDKAKSKDGKKLINLFTKPRPKNMKLRRATRDTHPEEWAAFIEYARLDVDAMRSVHQRLPRWNSSDSERTLWLLDQAVNDRGIAIDLPLAESAIRAFHRASGTLAAAATAATGGAVTSTTQRQKTLDYLREEHGLETDDLQKKTVDKLLKGEMSDGARDLLENRQQAAATSPAKYKVLLKATSRDGRLRGTLQFCGASRTGRDAGRLFQPQNLPKPLFKADVIESGIDAMKFDCEDLLFDSVGDLCASAIRGCVIAEPGNKLLVSDLSNIEGRVLAWLAGEDWKLEAFRRYDRGEGLDLYMLAYAKAFGVAPAAVAENKKSGDGSMRSQGKVMELAGGFGGALGAYRRIGGSAIDNLNDEQVLVLVKAWRAAHPAIINYWYACERAFRAAIKNPGDSFVARLLTFDCRDDAFGVRWLRMKLPSGRFLCYPSPEIDENIGMITYDGVNQYTRKWERIETYYGKIIENATQAVARDVFMAGFRNAEAAGYPVVLRVHDELVCEVPDTDNYSVDKLSAMMSTNPSWAVGLPLAAAGHSMYRYSKGD